jgi:hypothetical protein
VRAFLPLGWTVPEPTVFIRAVLRRWLVNMINQLITLTGTARDCKGGGIVKAKCFCHSVSFRRSK